MSKKKTSYPKQDIRILLLEGLSQTAIDTFHAAGYSQIEAHAKSLPEDELKARIAEAHIIGIRSRTQLTPEVLAHARRLMAIGCFCIGTNQVDTDAAELAGIPVFNAPYSNTRSVAELVIAEAIMLMRGIPQKSAECHRGGWSKSAAGSHEARGKTLGIIGYGHIGTQVGVLAEAFGMRVLFYDIASKLAVGNVRPVGELDELLASSDFVTLHVPETPQTQGMIGAAELATMKPGAHLINASRGTVVDLEALADALRRGQVGGAAIDVFPEEPEGATDDFQSPLCGLGNVILTPHIGGSTEEAQEAIGREVASALTKFVNSGATTGAVNFPPVELPQSPGAHRILNVHKNQPGVLRDINHIVSDRGANIRAQLLSTETDIGYLIMDLDHDVSDQVKHAVAALPTSVKTRILY